MDKLQKSKDTLRNRQRAYQQVFNDTNQYTSTVLEDLAKFCRAHDSAFHPDTRMHAILEGRREVWLRIEKYLKLSPDQIWRLHTGLNE